MKKPILAVDIDDVLFPFVPELAKYHNQNFNTELDIDHFHSYMFSKVWGTTDEEAHKRVMKFLDTDYLQVSPLEGALDALMELSLTFSLVVVTSRDNSLRPMTEAWIEKYFKGLFKEVIMAGNPYTGNGHEAKSAVCLRIGAEYLIDDQMKYCMDCANNSVKSILFGDYRWNRGELPLLCFRAASWQDVTDMVYVRS